MTKTPDEGFTLKDEPWWLKYDPKIWLVWLVSGLVIMFSSFALGAFNRYTILIGGALTLSSMGFMVYSLETLEKFY